MGINAVIDTNVWISALLNPHGHPALLRASFEAVVLIEERCKTVMLMGEMTVCRDKDDNRVIETAVAGGAQYIVTRDDDIKRDETVIDFLAQHGISVVTIGNFLQYLGISTKI